MQILHLLRKLLHFSVFYNGLVLVLAGKRCLPLISDGTDMLLSFILSSCLYSGNSQALPARKLYMGGGVQKHPQPSDYSLIIQLIVYQISLVFLLVCRSLRSGFPTPFQHLEVCPLRATSGGSQTAAAGFLYIRVLRIHGGKDEYYKEENVHRTG